MAPSIQAPEKTDATTEGDEQVKNTSSDMITTTPAKPKYRFESIHKYFSYVYVL